MSLKKAVGLIKKYSRFLITTHRNPEADALGSELAFLYLLRKVGKSGFIVNESNVPPECKFLPGSRDIRVAPVKTRMFDCAVFLDCSDASRAGSVTKIISGLKSTLNIDHHISNSSFAKVNWVDWRASCTCEMVYRIFKLLGIEINLDVATMLYSGIVVDTGSFRYRNTTSSCHRIAASLIGCGVDAAEVYSSLYENNRFLHVRLLNRILSTAGYDSRFNIAWVDISRKVLGRNSYSADLSEMALSILRSVAGIKLAMVFKEIGGRQGRVRVNFRSQGSFDCNRLAAKFGGGGHKNASGATVNGDFKIIKNKIISSAKELAGESG